MWQWVEAIILGFLQGATEFIPVSSSGHLVVAQNFMSGASDHLFLEFINIGTTLALLVFFRKRIWGIVQDIVVRKNYRLARNILITAIPAGVVGYSLSDYIAATAFFGSVLTVVVSLVVVGLVMIFLEKLPKASSVPSADKMGPWRALLIGVVQTFALIPGVSRSGSTIITGRLMGLTPAQAAEYSFLASLPIMLAVCLKVLVTDFDYLAAHAGTLIVSNIVAFASGLLAVGFLMRFLSKNSLAIFGWYRIGLALVVVVLLSFGIMKP